MNTTRALYLTAALAALPAVLATGCNSRSNKPTMDNIESRRVQHEINQYQNQTASGNDQAAKQTAEEINVAFADLDKEIAELESIASNMNDARRPEAQRKLEALRNRRAELSREYNQAKFDALKADVKETLGWARR